MGVIVGGAATLWAGGLAITSAAVAWGAPAEFKTFLAWLAAGVLGVLALVFLHWAYCIATLSYVVGRDALTITWGFRRVVVPVESIQRMVPGRTVDETRVEGLNWWGCHVGVADVRRIGYTIFYSTHSSPDELLYVVTDGEAYALTVSDQAGFAEAIQARASLGPLDFAIHRAVATGMAALPFWRDRAALVAAGLAAAACALLAGYVFANYPGLPDVVQINYPDLGGIVRIGDKSELLRVAQVGFGILVVNAILGILLHSRERAAGLWLLGTAGILQVVLLAAAIAAFERA
jgi:hypothetical protein